MNAFTFANYLIAIVLFPNIVYANPCPPPKYQCAFAKPSSIRVHVIVNLSKSIEKKAIQNNSFKFFAGASCGNQMQIKLKDPELNNYFSPGEFSVYFCKNNKIISKATYQLNQASIIECNIDGDYKMQCKSTQK